MSAPSAGEGTTIEVRKDGPYRVSGPCALRNARGEELTARASYALCRCGNSSSKPFCDGTHAKIGFSGARLATGPVGPADAYRGKRITIHDQRGICAHSGVCTDNLSAVFRLGKEPWIDADAAPVEEIVALVGRCPSGALSCSIERAPAAVVAGERSITASENGPYFVTGAIELRDDGASPAFPGRYALCRCGGSKMKPFCDGTHWTIGFDESRGRQAGVFVPPLGVNRFGLLLGGALIAGVIGTILALDAAGKREAPGVFGWGALFSDLNLALEILLVAGLTFGYWLAKRGNIAAHRANQTVWVLVNAVLVVLIMAGAMQDVRPAGVSDFAKPQVAVAWIHASLGAATVLGGLWLVLQMNDILPRRLHVRGWKTLMRATLAGYWLVALFGLAVYYVWFLR
jgi:CDGSH-type Zn-finger protein/uncharacterized membrane protein YozB (DUF420 family)